jgi:hypothetical protein
MSQVPQPQAAANPKVGSERTRAATSEPVLTRIWRRTMTPTDRWSRLTRTVRRRQDIVVWGTVGSLLACWWLVSWLHVPVIIGFERQLQESLLGIPWGGNVIWCLRGDGILHQLTTMAGVLWLRAGLILFKPSWPALLPFALMAIVALIDELGQYFSAYRAFQWQDLANDGLGILWAGLFVAVQQRWLGRSRNATPSLDKKNRRRHEAGSAG